MSALSSLAMGCGMSSPMIWHVMLLVVAWRKQIQLEVQKILALELLRVLLVFKKNSKHLNRIAPLQQHC